MKKEDIKHGFMTVNDTNAEPLPDDLFDVPTKEREEGIIKQTYNGKYDIDSILDKITEFGIDSLDFYEKKVLENPNIRKKLSYQHHVSLNKIIGLLDKFDIKSDRIHIEETFYIDGEILLGDYNEDKFNEIIHKIGKNNFINLCRFEGIFKKSEHEREKVGVVGKMEYTNKIIEKLKVYPILINAYKDRTELGFYNNINDEIIELSRLEKAYSFYSIDDANKYLKILKSLITDNDILNFIKKELPNIKIYKNEF